MSAVINPYAPPKSKLSDKARGNQSMWRDGANLVLLPGSAFPDRCIKCNDSAAPPARRYKLYWHSAWLYLLVLVNILIYLIVALAVRKRTEVEVGLCERHQRQGADRARHRLGRIRGPSGGYRAGNRIPVGLAAWAQRPARSSVGASHLVDTAHGLSDQDRQRARQAKGLRRRISGYAGELQGMKQGACEQLRVRCTCLDERSGR